MSSSGERLGAKLRSLRRREGLTQAEMSRRLGISASYMNLIENEKRPLTAPLLIRLASEFGVDVASFATGEDELVRSELMEVFGDPLFEDSGITNEEVRELVAGTPGIAKAVASLYAAYQESRDASRSLVERLDGPLAVSSEGAHLPSEEVSDLLDRHNNHFPALEEAAESLWDDAGLDEERLYDGLCRYMGRAYGVRVEVTQALSNRPRFLRRFDPDRKQLILSEVLPPRSRNFQLAHQIALLDHSGVLDEAAQNKGLTTDDSRALARVALANYFAAAVLMPYERFLRAAKTERYDIELLGHRFRTSFEQVCHRLTTLRRPGHEGIPFHMLRVDVAGNLSKRFRGSGIRFARFSGACPRWNVFQAFATPGVIHTQVSTFPDGGHYFCVARTVRSTVGGYRAPTAVRAVGVGCRVERAHELVYADGVDVGNESAAVPVGVACRLCERTDCEQRAMPALHAPLVVDENMRGASFYASGSGD